MPSPQSIQAKGIASAESFGALPGLAPQFHVSYAYTDPVPGAGYDWAVVLQLPPSWDCANWVPRNAP